MKVRQTVLAGCVALFTVIFCLTLSSPARAEEPGWRPVSAGLEGGTVVDLAISPAFASDGLLFAVTDNGRVFRFADGKWTPIYSQLATRAIRRVIFSPTFATDSRLFAISNEAGVFVSQNGGITWTLLGATGVPFDSLQAPPNYAVEETIYAGGAKTLYRMKADGSQLTQLASGLLLTDTVLSLAFSPAFATDSTIFAGTKSSGVVRSIDGGVNWHSVGLAGLRINALAMTPGNVSPPTLFAGTGAAGAPRGLYRSTDNGDTWELATAGPDDKVIEAIAVSPNYAVDKRLYAGTNFSDLYTSTDGGDSWTPVDDPLLPVGVKSIALHPDFASNPTLFVGQSNDLGVAVSPDAGGQWEMLNSGLFGLTVGDLFIWSNLADQTALFARAYPAGIYRSDDRGGSWQSIYGDNLPKSRLVKALAVSPQYDIDKTVYLTMDQNGVWRSTNAGLDWQKINDASWSNSPKTNPLVISPAFGKDGTLFVGIENGGIYRSTDRGDSWQRVYEPAAGSNPHSLAISPNYAGDGTVFAAVGGTILYSKDKGDSWSAAQSGLSSQAYRQLAVSPNFANDATLYAVGTQKSTFYRSTDGGATWQAVADRFPGSSLVAALALSPDFAENQTIYAGLNVGVYVSTDKGESWQPLAGGLPVWDVVSLAISRGLAPKLYAGTAGGGVWQYNPSQPSPNLSCEAPITGSVTLDSDLQCSETALIVNAPAGATIDCAGHTLTGSYPGVTTGFGIQVIGSSHVTIRNCHIRNFKIGIAFQGSSSNTLLNSSLRANGIGVWISSLARADSQQLSTDNTVNGNTFSQNGTGLLLGAGADFNRLTENTIQHSADVGIDINTAGHILISGNTVHSNAGLGISLLQSNGVTVTANTILSQTVGVSLNGQGGLFNGNTWRNNSTGLELVGTSTNNTFYNNNFSNLANVSLAQTVGANRWNVSQRAGPNVIGGPSIGGNFWGGPDNSSFSQTCADAGSDGFCDAPNPLGNGNLDQLPLAPPAGLVDCTAGPQWAILVYLNGDNDLDFWTGRLFNRLEQVAGNPCVQIHALWDRSGTGDSNLYWVQPDGNPFVLADYVEDVNVWSYGELDMGNPQTLIHFVNRTRTASGAPHTMLSIVGHGNGWSPSSTATPLQYFHTGISFDESGGGSSLSTNILGAVLGEISANGADPIDLLYFDACLMAMAETLHPLQNFARYVVASENESFTSYPYDRFLGGIGSGTTPVDLANTIVNEHHQSLPGYPRTLAAFDLARMADVTNAIHNFADSMLDANHQIEIGLSDGLLAVFDEAQKLDSNVDLLVDNQDGYVDLFHLASLVSQRIGNASVQNAANALQNALTAAPNPLIINNRAASGSYAARAWNLDNANGLSIYLPLGEADWRQDFYNGSELSLAEATLWDEFVRALASTKFGSNTIRPAPLNAGEERPGPLEVLEVYDIYLPALQR